MPLQRYGVLKGRVLAGRREDGDDTPHYQIHVEAAGTHWRVSVNVRSGGHPPELLYAVDERFQHPVGDRLLALPPGFHALPRRPGELALDYIRANLFDRRAMRPLPPSVPGPANDLSDLVEHYVRRAIADPAASLCAFGERWGPERRTRDKVFGFRPGNGIHQVHMNQGNDHRHRGENGVWQDGALLLDYPDARQWVAVFLAFQSQTWHTDDRTGHPLATRGARGPAHRPSPREPDGRLRIVAAVVNPVGPAPEAESVTLLNPTAEPVELDGWQLADEYKHRQRLEGTVAPGDTLVVRVQPPVRLGNQGGVITLLTPQGWKVHGVAYTAAQAREEGATIDF